MDPNNTACSGTGLHAGSHGAIATHPAAAQSVYLRSVLSSCYPTYGVPDSKCKLLMSLVTASLLRTDAATAAFQVLLCWQRLLGGCSITPGSKCPLCNTRQPLMAPDCLCCLPFSVLQALRVQGLLLLDITQLMAHPLVS
jgi:hypothetical protein